MNDLLGLLAEVAVGFTGFAAIASALGSSPSEADMLLDRLRLRNLVEIGVAVVIMSILPLVLQQAPNGEAWAWSASAALLTAVVFGFFIVHGGRNRVVRVSDLTGYSRFGAVALWGLGLIAFGGLVIALLSPDVLPVPFAYLLALTCLTVMLGVYFVRIASSLLSHNLGSEDIGNA